MLKSIQILLTIAAYYDYKIWKMDVKITFLNGNLIEDVYMTQPEGFVHFENSGKVCNPLVVVELNVFIRLIIL